MTAAEDKSGRVHFTCSPAVTEAADREAREIAQQLHSFLPASAEVLHIGATSVPDCLTKGDLDLVVRVDGNDFPAAREALDARYNKNLGSVRDESFASYSVDGRAMPTGLQLVTRGSAYDDFHQFWERMRASPLLRDQYNQLKRQWEGRDMEDYRAAKSAFIGQVNAAGSTGQERP